MYAPPSQTPGVYVREVPSGSRPIEAVGTSTAGFVGVAPRADAPRHEPILVTSWADFCRRFVARPEDLRDPATLPATTDLVAAAHGFFQNGGSRLWIVNIAAGDAVAGDGTPGSGISALSAVDDVAIVAAPGFLGAADHAAIVAHCTARLDRFAILDLPDRVDDLSRLTRAAGGGDGGSGGDAGEGGEVAEPEAGGRGERAAARRAARAAGSDGLKPAAVDSGLAAAYYPWGVGADPLHPDQTRATALSGHLAGVYARVDALRGVFKAPANEGIRGITSLTHRLDDAQQSQLNAECINCIRFFEREGVRIWGARTLAGAASEWRYVPVRRLFTMVEQSIVRGTRWVVFEPNDERLWARIRRDIRGFLIALWRAGALAGVTPEEAFFVKCDAETNPIEDRRNGIVRAVIGMAPVRPAEFVLFEVAQHDEAGAVE